jgi:hypothetical protein
VSKILFLGDTHCSSTTLRMALGVGSGIDAIFQMGDFGFWPRNPQGQEFLRLAANSPIPLYWLPGNHEDWDRYEYVIDNYTYDEDGFAKYGSMRISPKTHSWEWDGIKFGVLGGAYSVDRAMGKEGVRWFPQEVPQYSDIDPLPDHVDVFLTHEAALNLAQVFNWAPVPPAWEKGIDWDVSAQSQDVIRQAILKTDPQIHVHGHWHWQGSYQVPDTNTVSIALDRADGRSLIDSSVILDTERRTWYNWHHYLYEPEGDGLWRMDI